MGRQGAHGLAHAGLVGDVELAVAERRHVMARKDPPEARRELPVRADEQYLQCRRTACIVLMLK
ncbi:MAG: hypothetical protein NTX64_18315 [Elusimicrobia bacterium]|nr:hypothetical protein [Elusimicrobiota bacterium]